MQLATLRVCLAILLRRRLFMRLVGVADNLEAAEAEHNWLQEHSVKRRKEIRKRRGTEGGKEN